jgi:tRNA-dihydrouridine synthase A
MIGRAAYDDPWLFATVDRELFGDEAAPVPSRAEVVAAFLPYVEERLAAGAPLQWMSRHLLGLFAGRPGARAWRRHIAETAHLDGAGVEVLVEALAKVPAHVRDERAGGCEDRRHLGSARGAWSLPAPFLAS